MPSLTMSPRHTGETHEEKMSRLTLGKTGEGA